MKRRRVVFTVTARRHVRREKDWWFENRAGAELVASELEAAVQIVALLPGAGTLYEKGGIPGLRRLYLPKIVCHIYYTFSDDEVMVRALWGARRRHGPRLKT